MAVVVGVADVVVVADVVADAVVVGVGVAVGVVKVTDEEFAAMQARISAVMKKSAPVAIPVTSAKRNKFGAVKTTVDGITFDSKAEARRYTELKLLEAGGELSRLQLQPEYELMVNGEKIGRYTADFRYLTKFGETVVEDVKGVVTREFRRTLKLMKAIHRIDVVVIGKER